MTQKKPQERYDVGMAGAGAMGRNLVLNIADHGFSVAGYDKDQTKKVLDTGHKKRGEIPPGARMPPAKMVSAVRAATVG